MTYLQTTLIAVAIATFLTGCNTDVEPTIPLPEIPDPSEPIEDKEIVLTTTDATITALQQAVSITDASGVEKQVAVDSFKGIQFASQSRFNHSSLLPLAGDIDATQFQAVCPQNRPTAQQQAEDCLNLNIWRPADAEQHKDLPVYVYIHGGDFEYGSGSDALINGDTVVAQGSDDGKPFIFVSINYRLGILGSHWTDGKTSPKGGNFGLGDQKQSLQWVNQYIEQFGGDPLNVTIMGQGAGAMSVGIFQDTQQQQSIVGTHYQRAIMQSNPYGFEYTSYDVAKDKAANLAAKFDQDISQVSWQDLLQQQAKMSSPLTSTANWVAGSVATNSGLKTAVQLALKALGIDVTFPSVDATPLATLMPFAPYIEYKKNTFSSDIEGYHFIQHPSQNDWTVPTVIGVNKHESNSFGMLPSLTFLIPTILGSDLFDNPQQLESNDPELIASELMTWLDDANNQAWLVNQIQQMAKDPQTQAQAMTAYKAVTTLFYGLGDTANSGALMQLTDFYPNLEGDLSGAINNMQQFKTLLNDTLFSGPARQMAASAPVDKENAATFYHFDFVPSFNMWSYRTDSETDLPYLGDLIKTLGCVRGACNGSELAFVFNKAVRFDGSDIHPTSQERALMGKVSRLWFTDALFDAYQYDTELDSTLVIDDGGEVNLVNGWDAVNNIGADPSLREGRLTGLQQQQLLLWYIDDSQSQTEH
ncbi:carboxylesterase family protein [Shewanella waksmanii]|uniref:carboxylesterase family protein n=1 Tax=Shewanella waksmanii TaxID=213783 RepID=UPI00048F82D0|nr:carboxylesterase family protein [Shewanella waksmanii]